MEQVDRQYEFHRLARSWPRYRWWRPLLTALLGIAFYLVLTILLLLVGAVAALATSADVEQYLAAAEAIDLSDPVIFALTLVSLILMIPALGLAALILGPRPIGLLSSVAGRIRWRWLATCFLVAIAVFLASFLLSALIGFFFPGDAVASPTQQDTSLLVIMLALSIFAVPFQAAAEEYVFRGFLMQAIGSWLRHPAFAILLPVPLFVVAHGYDPLGQTSVAVFAIFAGWISWRTGGLEAAIAVHAINNMTIFVLGAFGLADVNSTEGSVGDLIGSVLAMAVTAGVIVRLAKRRGIARTRSVTIIEEPAHAMAAPDGRPMPPAHQPWIQSGHAPGGQRPAQMPAHGTWDQTQYDTARYDAAHVPPTLEDRPAALGAGVAPPVPPTRPTWPDSSGRPAPGRASTPTQPPTPTSTPTPTATSTPTPTPTPTPPADADADAARATSERDYSADRHPSGPAHPPGPGYPSGTPHPAGPGYPGTGPSVADKDRGHADTVHGAS
ncbi:CPBP family intramembrane metalloprotease [Arthrobacter cheniae]|uniref:CPBP family intramembrane metalloprotease n=1 Tax=Arthrobacter cheniae TaxID=1258888 RepID=A0A3A5M552_9MICC|nr:CPBP family glutamic-type intramembrane protease [Arthrobacter cheniae]RJT81038.1 CPBP family intramembrane metalloprotease [Arthrobacter cheniae]